MSVPEDWTIPGIAQPKADEVGFDLERVLGAVLQLRADIPNDAFTAGVLGTERHGSAVLIDGRGLALTIGYLITEAESVWLTSHQGQAIQAHVLAYDFVTGFGLLQTLGRLNLPHLELGSAKGTAIGASVIFAAGGGRKGALQARIVGRREFAGYWEYLLEEALYTTPAHPHWGGGALIDEAGRLIGIGSLLISTESGSAGNMVVPIDLLPPILDDLRRHGRATRPNRPWLGLYATEAGDRLVVAGVATNGPSEQAGVREGDVLLEIGGEPVSDLGDLWRTLWALGDAGVNVPLTLQRDERRLTVTVRSAERDSFLKSPRLH